MHLLSKKNFLWVALILTLAKNSHSASLEIQLSDWGIQNPREIHYVSLGWNSSSPDRLMLYDLRKQSPKIREIPVFFPQTPPEAKQTLWLIPSKTSSLNFLGGDYQSFFQAPSMGEVSYPPIQENTSDLKFSFNKVEDHFVGFWVRLFNPKISASQRHYLDVEKYSYLTFQIKSETPEKKIEINFADQNWEKKQDSVSLGSLEDFLDSKAFSKEWQRAWIPLRLIPPTLDKKHLANIVLTVKTTGSGVLEIRNMAFTQARRENLIPPEITPAPSLNNSQNQAMWVWSTEEILKNPESQNRLVTWSQKHKITDVFLQIPYQLNRQGQNWNIIWDQENLRNLIKQLNAQNIQVHALDGAPTWALTDSHERVLAWLEAILKFQKQFSPQRGFSGIHLDIEPYLLPGFAGIHRQSILRQYRDLLKKIRSRLSNSSLVFGVDIPFWMDGYNEYGEPNAFLEGRPFSDWVMELTDNVGLMSYRTKATGPDGVLALSAEEIQQAQRFGKKLWIGLETTPLPDETLLRMETSAQTGPFLQIESLAQGKARLNLLKSRPKQGVVLGTVTSRTLPGSQLSFFSSSPKKLEATIREIQTVLGSQPGFAGFALHSYESLQSWLK